MPATPVLEHPGELTADELTARSLERRAVEAVIWGMPAVNYDLMYQAMARNTTGTFNQIAYWSRLPDWKIQTLTPNPDAIYLTPFTNTAQVGPVVLEIPPADEGSITGTVMDVWQCALEDVGPAGVDQGQGGKYLILPPGYQDQVPAGYIPMQSDTYQGYALLRSIPRSGSEADVAKAVAYGKRIKLYPLSQAATPPATTFVDVVDIVYDSTITYDLRFFESLNRIVQAEPWLERDKAMIDQLKSIGIEKGNRSIPTRRPRTCSTTRPTKRTPGSSLDTRRLYRRTTTADTGRCRDRASCSKGRRVFSPSPMSTQSTCAASRSPMPISPPSMWAPVHPIC
jgi:hypothetical protein